MKKQIYYYEGGRFVVVQGNPEIQLGRELPTKQLELDMNDEVFTKWMNNPKKYKKQLDELAKKHHPKIKKLTKGNKKDIIKLSKLRTQEGETTT